MLYITYLETEKNVDCDNDIKKTQNKQEVLTTYFANWEDESFECL